MSRRLLLPMLALPLAALACGGNINIPQITTGPTQTIPVNEPAPDSKETMDVEIEMGSGQLDLQGGGAGLATGSIELNVAEWAPTITRGATSLKIAQKSNGNTGVAGSNVINRWTLQLGNVPMNLTLRAGAYEGTTDLSGVPLKLLSIRDGASKATVRFDAVNPEIMSKLSYETGASDIELLGLANANFEEMDFTGGAGNYTLDFTGALQRDAKVTIKAGLGNLRIVVPAGTNVTIKVSGGVTNVGTEGTWTVSGNNYSITGAGPTLTFNIDMGLGNLTLVNK
jgi:N-terminal domain of toast_rack, DUF2154